MVQISTDNILQHLINFITNCFDFNNLDLNQLKKLKFNTIEDHKKILSQLHPLVSNQIIKTFNQINNLKYLTYKDLNDFIIDNPTIDNFTYSLIKSEFDKKVENLTKLNFRKHILKMYDGPYSFDYNKAFFNEICDQTNIMTYQKYHFLKNNIEILNINKTKMLSSTSKSKFKETENQIIANILSIIHEKKEELTKCLETPLIDQKLINNLLGEIFVTLDKGDIFDKVERPNMKILINLIESYFQNFENTKLRLIAKKRIKDFIEQFNMTNKTELKILNVKKFEEILTNCRFPSIETIFNVSEKLFDKQDYIFNLFNKFNYLLIGGGTGIGKTAITPILFTYYQLNHSNKSRILISEPRIPAAKNPYENMLKNLGQYDFNETKQDIQSNTNFKNKKEVINFFNIDIIKKQIKVKSTETEDEEENEENVEEDEENNVKIKLYPNFKGNQIIKNLGLKYRGSDPQAQNFDKNKYINFVTDGTLYNYLLSKTKYLKTINILEILDILIIDEVHENSLNTIFTLFLVNQFITEDEKLNLVDRKYKNLKVILITASIQPVELDLYRRLLVGLYNVNELPNKTNFTVTETHVDSKEIVNLVKSKSGKNGLIFLPSKATINEYYKYLVDILPFTIVLQLTKDENIKNYENKLNLLLQLILDSKKYNYLLIATNIAESSITFPELDYVIDFGLKNNFAYNYKTHESVFEKQPMTKNSKIQRVGRIGRTKDGEYYYVYNKSDLVEYYNKLINENILDNILDFINYYKKDVVDIFEKMIVYFGLTQSLFKSYIIGLRDEMKFITNDFSFTSDYNNILHLKELLSKNKYFQRIIPSNLYFLYFYPTIESCYLVCLGLRNKLKLIFSLNFSVISSNSDIENALYSIKHYFNDMTTTTPSLHSLHVQFRTLENELMKYIQFNIPDKIIFDYKKPLKFQNTSLTSPLFSSLFLLREVKLQGEELFTLLNKSAMVHKNNTIDNAVKRSFYFNRTRKIFQTNVKNYKELYYFESTNKSEMILGHKV